MKKAAVAPANPPTLSALPTLQRAVRRSRRPSTALRPQDTAAAAIEGALQAVLKTVIDEETQRMTRRVYARLPHAIAQALAATQPGAKLAGE
jgi:hypothetical protein